MADLDSDKYVFRFFCPSCGWNIVTQDMNVWAASLCPKCKGKLMYRLISAPSLRYTKKHTYGISTKLESEISEKNDTGSQIIFECSTPNGNLMVVDEGNTRSLITDNVGYSCIYNNKSTYQPINKGVQTLLELSNAVSKLKRIAILGGGCCTIPRFIIQRFDNKVEIESVEIDKQINSICKKYFLNYIPTDKLHIIECDAFEFISSSSNCYDFIYVDLYNDSNIVEFSESKLFLQTVQSHLNIHGIAVFNRKFTSMESCKSLKHTAWDIFKDVQIWQRKNDEIYIIMSNSVLTPSFIHSYLKSGI